MKTTKPLDCVPVVIIGKIVLLYSMKTIWLAILISFLFHAVLLGTLAVLPLWTGPYLVWGMVALIIVFFAIQRFQHYKEQNKVNERWSSEIWEE